MSSSSLAASNILSKFLGSIPDLASSQSMLASEEMGGGVEERSKCGVLLSVRALLTLRGLGRIGDPLVGVPNELANNVLMRKETT